MKVVHAARQDSADCAVHSLLRREAHDSALRPADALLKYYGLADAAT